MTLQRAILEALDAARDSDPLSANQVFALISGDLHPRPTLSEVEADLRRLETMRHAVAINDVDRGLIYKITAAGRARALS